MASCGRGVRGRGGRPVKSRTSTLREPSWTVAVKRASWSEWIRALVRTSAARSSAVAAWSSARQGRRRARRARRTSGTERRSAWCRVRWRRPPSFRSGPGRSLRPGGEPACGPCRVLRPTARPAALLLRPLSPLRAGSPAHITIGRPPVAFPAVPSPPGACGRRAAVEHAHGDACPSGTPARTVRRHGTCQAGSGVRAGGCCGGWSGPSGASCPRLRPAPSCWRRGRSRSPSRP